MRNDPIILIVGFNLLTVLVMMTAPVAWDTDNLPLIWLLVLISQLFILVGFHRGQKRGLLTSPATTPPLSSGTRVMPYLFAFYVLTLPISYGYRMGFSPVEITGMASQIIAGLQDRAFGYQSALRGSGGPVTWTLYFFVSAVSQCFFVAGFVEWKRLSPGVKVAFAGLVLLDMLFALGRGTTFGVVSMVTTFFIAAMFWMRSRLGTVVLLSCLFAGSVALFSYNLYRRSGNVQRTVEITEFGRSTLIVDHPVLALIPEPLRPTYLNVLWYFGGGYYHASFAIDLDFKPTLFLGSNPALIALADTAGIDVWPDTYMYRLQLAKGIDALLYWHSGYTWYANDVSYFGVPFVLFGIAYLVGFSWGRSAQGDFLSKVVFVVLGNVLLFLFANSNYISSVFYSFMFVLPFWLFTRLLVGVVRVRSPRRRASRSSRSISMKPGTESTR